MSDTDVVLGGSKAYTLWAEDVKGSDNHIVRIECSAGMQHEWWVGGTVLRLTSGHASYSFRTHHKSRAAEDLSLKMVVG